jgi:hypothetical protein
MRGFYARDPSEQDARRVAAPTAGGLTHYRVDAIGSGIGDVIRSAGGWLFDRAMAGWDVNVLVSDDGDVRPLEILGAKTRRFDSAVMALRKGAWTQTLAVGLDALTAYAGVRDLVVAALDRGAELILWGDGWPAELDHRVEGVAHRLSAAACAFKGHALAAAGLAQGAVGPTESYRGRACWYSPGESDLMPLGCHRG